MRKLERDLGRVVPYLFPHLEGRHRGKRIQEFRKSGATARLKAGLASVETVKDGRRTVKKITAHRLQHDFRRTAVRNLVNVGGARGRGQSRRPEGGIPVARCGHGGHSLRAQSADGCDHEDRKPLIEMAGSTGLEPATSGLTVQCANQAAPRARRIAVTV